MTQIRFVGYDLSPAIADHGAPRLSIRQHGRRSGVKRRRFPAAARNEWDCPASWIVDLLDYRKAPLVKGKVGSLHRATGTLQHPADGAARAAP
jgi:hypothetical protein